MDIWVKMQAFSCIQILFFLNKKFQEIPSIFFPHKKNVLFLADKSFAPSLLTDNAGKNVSLFLDCSPERLIFLSVSLKFFVFNYVQLFVNIRMISIFMLSTLFVFDGFREAAKKKFLH